MEGVDLAVTLNLYGKKIISVQLSNDRNDKRIDGIVLEDGTQLWVNTENGPWIQIEKD